MRIDSISTSRIVAVVKGSDRYRVELKRAGRRIDATCTCPYYDVDLCKHIWVVIVAAEQQPLLQGKSLELVYLGIGEDDFDGDSDEDNDDSGTIPTPSDGAPMATTGRTPSEPQLVAEE